MVTTAYLIRHGVTPANKENRFAGRTGESLHKEGRNQVQKVAERLTSKGVTAVYCGPLTRTVESAAIIEQVLGIPLEVEEAFNEIDIPHWDGYTKQEIRAKFDAQYPTWLENPESFMLPGCETLGGVKKRAVQALEKLITKHDGESIIIVSHLIVIRCLVLHYNGMPIKDFRSVKIDNASITSLKRDGSNSVNVELNCDVM